MFRGVLFLSAALGLAACGGGAKQGSGEYTLPAGGETVIEFPSSDPMMVTFGFELGSPSWDATNDCPEQDVGSSGKPFMLQICGELADANAEPDTFFTPGFKGMHGGGVSFEPKDGVIRVRLTNHARQKMTFLVEAKEG